MASFKNFFKSIKHTKIERNDLYAFGIPLYSEYEHKPWINPNRTKNELQRLYEDSSTFPGILVQKEAITFYQGLGVFRGDIVILDWIRENNGKNKKIPQYFETRYGVNFFESLTRLENNKYIVSSIVGNFSEIIYIKASITLKGKSLLINKSEETFSNNSYSNGLTNDELMKRAVIQDEAQQIHDNKIQCLDDKKEDRSIQGQSLINNLSHTQFQNYMSQRLKADRIAIDNKDYIKSNEILWAIYEDINFTNFDRLEKNYRKLKDYTKEIEVIDLHIKSIENHEWETDFNGKKIKYLKERLSKVVALKDKGK